MATKELTPEQQIEQLKIDNARLAQDVSELESEVKRLALLHSAPISTPKTSEWEANKLYSSHASVNPWCYVEKVKLREMHGYEPKTLEDICRNVMVRAFESKRLGPPDRAGFPDCSLLPGFKPENQVCVAVWIEQAEDDPKQQ